MDKTSMIPTKKHVLRRPRLVPKVELREGRFHLIKKINEDPKEKNYEAGKSAPIKHPLHPKHDLMFVNCFGARKRKCLCCEDPLKDIFYWCPSCDVCINPDCVDRQPLISIDHPKRHEHTLTLFPRQTTLNCNVCALDDSRSPIYICPACDFVVHKRCIDLPWSIRISRHPHHRLSFTYSFALGDWVCNICRKKINNDYGGYICSKEGCSYSAHSRCATGKNVWDGQELEGVPEEVEEEVEPFQRLSDGTISHCSHEHPLELNEDTVRVYDEYRSCEACVMPVYDGNFYSCTLDCSFILHEACANMSPRIYHAIHPHPLILETEFSDPFFCSACFYFGTGFFYECKKCEFQLHVQCATTCEPLTHNSHVHPLFLTSAPEEMRGCSICKNSEVIVRSDETFNCIESKCNFSLCFLCAFIPQKVRYKHDEHILTLFYGEETSETNNWCELCEKKIKPGKRFYSCEDCCVTLHFKCLLGRDMNFGFGMFSSDGSVAIIPNNSMTRPVCSNCHKRCNQRIIFQSEGLKLCSFACVIDYDRANVKVCGLNGN